MRNKIIHLLLVVMFVSTTTVFPQSRVKELIVNGGCNYDGEPFDSKVYSFESDAAAVAVVDRILDPLRLVRNFDVRAADVRNAAAVIRGETRYLLYNQEFIRRVKAVTKTDWSAISIMAHEIGHHLNGHTLIPGGSRPLTELEADSFSGFVLYKMGATLEQAEAAINAISSERGSSTHPPKHSRLAAIESGWTKAQDQVQTSRSEPKDPRTTPGTTRPSTKLKLGIYRATARHRFEGYNVTKTVVLTIKIKSIDRNGNVRATVSSPSEGPLNGTIDNEGNLQLEGFIIRTKEDLAPKSTFSLKATVKDGTLINGKYLDVAGWYRVTGVFNIAKWEGDF